MSTAHAPGVACVIVGIDRNRYPWSSRDNGRIVVIEKFYRHSLRGGPMWLIRPRPGEGLLHGYRRSLSDGPLPDKTDRLAAYQKYLIPIAPEEGLNEQVVGTEVDDGEFVLA